MQLCSYVFQPVLPVSSHPHPFCLFPAMTDTGVGIQGVSERAKVPPVNSTACTISKPTQHPATKPSTLFSCCLGNVFSSLQKDLETGGARPTMQKANTRSHISRFPNLLSPIMGLGERSTVLCCDIQREGWATEQLRVGGEKSGKLSNSCTEMALRKHLACAFHPIIQACFQAKRLFRQPHVLLEGTHGQAACHLPPFVPPALAAHLSRCSCL